MSVEDDYILKRRRVVFTESTFEDRLKEVTSELMYRIKNGPSFGKGKDETDEAFEQRVRRHKEICERFLAYIERGGDKV